MNLQTDEICLIITASFSLFGSLTLITTFLIFKQLKFFYRKLVFILSVYDFLQVACFLFPGQKNEKICKVQIYLLAFFGFSPYYWTSVIAIISYLKVVKGYPDRKLNIISNWFQLVLWILNTFYFIECFIFSPPLNSPSYWCWNQNEGIIIAAYVSAWIIGVCCIVFYLLTIIRLRKISKILSKNQKLFLSPQYKQIQIQFRMALIPLIYLICIIPGTLEHLFEITNSSHSNSTLLHSFYYICSCLQGFFDFVIFVLFDSSIRHKIFNCCCSNSSQESGLSYQEFDENEKISPFGNFLFSQKNDPRQEILLDIKKDDV
ncbi:g protein-coupled receptor [Anaeramoeba ignava]|uniref:G protein-coupled receptor n=1 Tax=Anaeramoeba ignava TaxID=1746090 RepID=A0A9Q0LY82_ANAIG|nr:g protein-coupled receptor [Anaeramoeba ignava]